MLNVDRSDRKGRPVYGSSSSDDDDGDLDVTSQDRNPPTMARLFASGSQRKWSKKSKRPSQQKLRAATKATKEDLTDMCAHHGLRKSGNKTDLVKRLEDHEREERRKHDAAKGGGVDGDSRDDGGDGDDGGNDGDDDNDVSDDNDDNDDNNGSGDNGSWKYDEEREKMFVRVVEEKAVVWVWDFKRDRAFMGKATKCVKTSRTLLHLDVWSISFNKGNGNGSWDYPVWNLFQSEADCSRYWNADDADDCDDGGDGGDDNGGRRRRRRRRPQLDDVAAKHNGVVVWNC